MEQKRNGFAISTMIKKSFQNRTMIIKLAKNDFKTKYAGSFLGIFWAYTQPVITILLYWFVFQIGFRSRPVGDYPFVLWLTAGLVPWFFFSDAWNGATSALISYSFLVKKVLFDVEILPMIKIVAAFMVNIAFTVLVLLMMLLSGQGLSIHAVQIIYCLFCTMILTWGLGYITSAVVVFVKDLTHLLTVVLQVLMWVTPIMWDIQLAAGSYPWLVKVLKLNPVYYIVQCYRDALFQGPWFWEHTEWTIYFWVLTLIICVAGASVFRKLKPHFADVL